MAGLRQERMLQGVKLRMGRRIREDDVKYAAHDVEPGQLIHRLFAVLLLHEVDQPIEQREQDVFLGLVIIGQLPAAHADFLLDLGKGEVLNALLVDDGRGRIDNFGAANGGNADAAVVHGVWSHQRKQGMLWID